MRSAKCEREYLGSGIQELNFKGAVLYRGLLADELVEAVIGNLTVSQCIGIHSMVARRAIVRQS